MMPSHALPAGMGRLRGTRAFSLIELMVSMSILALLIVLLMSMVDGATKLWRLSENRVDSYREGRAAVNMIASDLGSMLASTNTNFFILDTAAHMPSSATQPPKANNIFFLSAQSSDAQEEQTNSNKPQNKSDLCLVGYFLAYDKVSKESPANSMNLYRYFLNSGDTFTAIKNQALLSDTLSTLPTATAPIGAEVVARNVTKFEMTAYSVDKNGKLEKFTRSTDTPMPDFLDIELTALNNESVKRFSTADDSDWTNTNSVTYKANARTFRTRVHLHTDAVKAVTPTPTPTPSPTP